MPTLMQKIRLCFRGMAAAPRGEREGVSDAQRDVGRSRRPSPRPRRRRRARSRSTWKGSTVAYLDDSGQLAHFLDTSDGEIVDVRIAEAATYAEPRYRRIPSRNANADADDRRAFIASLDASSARDALARSSDADSFRRALSADRTLERAWYNFRNDRAIAAIEAWLAQTG